MSFDDQVTSIVQKILSDSTQLPSEFISSLPQIVAQNPVSTAKTSGMRIASATTTSTVTTTGTTFAGGTDILGSALKFTASGSNSYIVRVSALAWQNSVINENFAKLNLDGADGGFMAAAHIEVAGHLECLAGVAYITPAAGEHSVNVRVHSNAAGTLTVLGGAGGAASNLPIIVTIEVA